ncbi:hypothetical protein KR044_011083, partial [Drosophila immigrans]
FNLSRMGFAVIVLSLLLTFVLNYLRNCYTYWEQHGIPQLRPHFLFGHFFKLNAVHNNDLLQETYDAFKGKCKVAGTYIYTRPIAVVTDLDLTKNILIKDFNNFVDRSDHPAPETVHRNPLQGHLFNLHGEQWRALRAKLSPTFTSGKIKYMFNTITDVSQQLEDTFRTEVGSGAILEVHDLLGRYTVDVIGSCAFGIECNSLKDPQAEFRAMAKELFTDTNRNIRWFLFKMNYIKLLSKIPLRTFGQEHIGFFVNIIRQTVELRERESIKRNDFMELLIELRKSDQGKKGLSLEQLAAQVFVFFIAGFETSSSNMSYALFELARNEESQRKLRSEIQSVLQKHGKLTYEAMTEMKYLDQVINETLRKYPALVTLTRVAAESYKFNDKSSNKEIVLERGTKVYIPVNAIHNDPEIYPEPHKFDPDRFEAEAFQQRHPMAFLGFGDGPRNCIGLRFGRMQVKVGLITLLNNFRFSPAPGEPTEVEIDTKSNIRRPLNGIKLRIERL